MPDFIYDDSHERMLELERIRGHLNSNEEQKEQENPEALSV